jgi:hypothetical protein
LMPLMNFRLAQPDHLIDINFIDGLDYVRSEKGVIRIGCLARQSRLLDNPIVWERCPLLAEALGYVGYEQIRNRGTLCGSLAHADPAAELPAMLLVLDGFVTVRNLTTKRVVAARDFFKSYLTTALSSVMKLRIARPRVDRYTSTYRSELYSRAGRSISLRRDDTPCADRGIRIDSRYTAYAMRGSQCDRRRPGSKPRDFRRWSGRGRSFGRLRSSGFGAQRADEVQRSKRRPSHPSR